MEMRWLRIWHIYKIMNFLQDRNSMEKMMRETYFIINFKAESKHQMKLASGKFQTKVSTSSCNTEFSCGSTWHSMLWVLRLFFYFSSEHLIPLRMTKYRGNVCLGNYLRCKLWQSRTNILGKYHCCFPCSNTLSYTSTPTSETSWYPFQTNTKYLLSHHFPKEEENEEKKPERKKPVTEEWGVGRRKQ